MKKTLLLLLLASLSLSKLFAIIIYQPYGDVLINSGSAICGNLSIEYKLPDSLKTGYTSTVLFVNKPNTQEFFITYNFVAKEGASISSNIVNNLNPFFWPINGGFTSNQSSWIQHVNIQVDENTTKADIYFSPYQKCFEIAQKCEEVKYTEKQIRYATDCGSSSGIILTKRISGDSLIIDSEEVPVLTVCIEKDFGIDSTVVVFSDLENKKYSLYRTETLDLRTTFGKNNYSLIDGLITTEPFLEILIPDIVYYTYKNFLGTADLSDCLVNGFENNISILTKIYPNPISESFSIDGYHGTITLSNQLGKVFTVYGNEMFDASGLPKGIYFANFELDGILHQEKLIIE